jgi:hypothetical protein
VQVGTVKNYILPEVMSTTSNDVKVMLENEPMFVLLHETMGLLQMAPSNNSDVGSYKVSILLEEQSGKHLTNVF